MIVTVYTAGPACNACRFTKRHLDKRGIAYTEVAMDRCDWIRDYAIEAGFKSAPIVRVGDEFWDGYRPDRIDALCTSIKPV